MEIVKSIRKGSTGGYVLYGLRSPYGSYTNEITVCRTFTEVVELLRKAALVDRDEVAETIQGDDS